MIGTSKLKMIIPLPLKTIFQIAPFQTRISKSFDSG